MIPRRLQIGMWDYFTEDRWDELADKLISGMEICSFLNREALLQVSDFCCSQQIAFGVHAPILGDAGYRLPQVNAPESEAFQEALEQILTEVQLASSVGADYMLFHYPFYPVFQEPFTPYPTSRSRTSL